MAFTFVLGLVAGAVALVAGRTGPANNNMAAEPAWSEVEWPFPLDQWGRGKAFRCPAEQCGSEVNVYVRAKIGFCSCTTGVSDDSELDRISDFDFLDGASSALAPGREIKVGWMNGRSRGFDVRTRLGRAYALTVGLNDHCDAIVATAVTRPAPAGEVEPLVLNFLGTQPVLRFAKLALGL